VLVQHFNNVVRRGAGYVMSSRSEPAPADGFSGRAARTLQNNLESCAMYAPVALAIVIMHRESTITSIAALIYMAARIIFAFCYWFKIE
ncbi:MAPEG family protein, partial [Acinetobacter baumannii]